MWGSTCAFGTTLAGSLDVGWRLVQHSGMYLLHALHARSGAVRSVCAARASPWPFWNKPAAIRIPSALFARPAHNQVASVRGYRVRAMRGAPACAYSRSQARPALARALSHRRDETSDPISKPSNFCEFSFPKLF